MCACFSAIAIKHRITASLLVGIALLTACSREDANPLANAPIYPIQHSVLHDVVNNYCIDCHNPEKMKGDLDLASVVDGNLNDHPHLWMDVAWAISSQEMPPKDNKEVPRPDQKTYAEASAWLTDRLNSQEHSQALLASDQAHTLLIDRFCLSCHNETDQKGGIVLAELAHSPVHENPELWEKALRKLNARQMPPPNRKRPSEEAYQHVTRQIENTLDALAKENPHPGNVGHFRRLTRTEYQNAVRDLLALEIDVTRLLPADQESHGFDNVTVSDLSPTLLDRYLSSAQKISRLALGNTGSQPLGSTYRNKPDQSQEQQIVGLPLGTQGGMLVEHYFPVAGKYRAHVRLSRDRDEVIEGLHEEHELHFLINSALQKTIPLIPPTNKKQYHFDESELYAEFNIHAGPQHIGVTFPRKHSDLIETYQKPFNVAFNRHRHPRKTPAIYELAITGPYNIATERGSTPSREKLFRCYPNNDAENTDCARNIIIQLATLAYRRPLNTHDVETLMQFYRKGEQEENFEAGIERALSAILVNPNFLFRIENQPPHHKTAYAISDLELASRLAFFLWNSLPDQMLIDLATSNRLNNNQTLQTQVQRMLADPRSQNMIENFTEQWLYLKNLESITPDARLFPDFDNNLRQAMREETLTFVSDMLGNDTSILRLLDAKHSFINERLAKHYNIPHIFGPRLRRVAFDGSEGRGGLLRHASLLTVTSYATRTSPVVRGNWILKNFIGTPPPPPPPDVPDLEDNLIAESLSVRERLAKHREDPSCASCHNLMDPIGFALEHYDAIGRKRSLEHGVAVDANAVLPDGQHISNSEDLIQNMLQRPDIFARTFTEKLMVFALGRGLEYTDAPTVRNIIRSAKKNDFRFSAIVTALVQSTAFRFQEPHRAAMDELVLKEHH